jgi:UDP-2,3-diacylglucosamine hydrolase
MPTLFISDLHLSPERPAAVEVFFAFLAGPARQAQALYILGDLFEAWVGDDDELPSSRLIVRHLAEFRRAGPPLYFMHGNRDFLIGPAFAAEVGAELLPECHVVDLYGRSTLLLHGDLLCTDDTAYLGMRAQLRDERFQQGFLAKPLAERWALAKQLRIESQTAMQSKSEVIMDANQQTVERYMIDHKVQDLIHGHTHRPAIHEFVADGKAMRRIVLGDWYEQDSVLVCEGDRRELRRAATL